MITGDQQLLKQINRMAVVRTLCHEPELSRADLAGALGLTKSTVSLLVRELVEEGWLNESDLVTTGSLGRRPTPLHIDGNRLALLGAELGIDEACIVATTLLGEVIERTVIQYDDATDAASCLKLVAKALAKLSRRVVVMRRGLLGVGIGLLGGVDEAAGVLHFAPHLGWRKVDAAAQLRRHLVGSPLEGLPLYVQNDANVAALAEFEFFDQTRADPLVYLCIGYGVGAGVIVSDRLLTGYRGFAGEVGHTILEAGGPLCSCGRRGCADALIGLGRFVGPEYSSAAMRSQALETLFSRVQTKDPTVLAEVEHAGQCLGILLNNVWASLDPMRIVLGGPAMRFGQALLAPAMRVLNGYADAAQLKAPTIASARFGDDAVAIGAAALVRYHLTRPFSLHARIENPALG